MKKLFKITVMTGCIIMLMIFFSAGVYAESSADDVYKKQLETIDSQGMLSAMPEQARESLSNIGINSADIKGLASLDTKRIFEEIAALSGKSGRAPLNSFALCIGIMLLCTLTEGFRFGLAEKRIHGAGDAVLWKCDDLLGIVKGKPASHNLLFVELAEESELLELLFVWFPL